MLAKFEKVRNDIWAGKYNNPGYLPHWHIDHEIIHCEKGRIYVTLNGQAIVLEPGDSIYFYSSDIHQAHSDPGTVSSMIVFNPLNLPPNFPINRMRIPVIKNDSMFHQIFYQVYKEINERPPYFKEYSVSVLCQYLLFLMRNSPKADALDVSMRHKVEEQKRLIETITQASYYMTFQDAAKVMGYSESYFSRYFKRTFGVTFSQYMNAIRTTDAILMLKSSPEMTITQVAISCGFSTIRHFNRVFKELTGSSPSEYLINHPDSSTPSFRMGERFDPTLSSANNVNYFEDPDVIAPMHDIDK